MEIKMKKPSSTLIAILATLFLSACGDDSGGAHPVGTVLPGGMVVTASSVHVSMNECVDHAKSEQQKIQIKNIHESKGEAVYAAQIETVDNKILHACAVNGQGKFIFTAAKPQ